ncbi:hypothetical protein TRIATDRAFT_296879 [Trichoderma atroviride IMI 206040]|uniref:Uncharacterized protein n=1 Tax=Hypocrea atroviridis (strain ATCC 20476 / IMI 206040) TaxID=452589 RepID=G9NES4_HYPAI|nr:uncharacterized protein TRIATDRAFT_296879 [Trichoderma atroviride IMI 206040]EHK50805.1 hypothetical protein TRIATDRAFT_296879 [Trichoderma atroviride IMI 206040]
MRDKRAPRGKVFNFKPQLEWSDGTAQQVHLSSLYRSHMVVVLGKALQRPPGWVRIATVTPTLPATFDSNHYLPIYPTGKHQKGGVQLKLCGSFDGQTILRLLSYVKVDEIEEVPLEILSEIYRSDGLSISLQEKSFGPLQHYSRK